MLFWNSRLGTGYKLALRDMEIRGAGNIWVKLSMDLFKRLFFLYLECYRKKYLLRRKY